MDEQTRKAAEAPNPEAGEKVLELGHGGHEVTVETHGLTITVDERTFTDDFETLELLADVDGGNPLKTPALMRRVLGEGQYGAAKAALAVDGRTSITAMARLLADVYEAVGNDAKN